VNQQTHLILVRHGETDWNRLGRYQGTSDIPLNELGLRQAELVGERLSSEHIDAIIASPLVRAYATAEAIALGAGSGKIVKNRDLMERAYGDAEGMTIPEREAAYPGGEWPGLETPEQVFARARRILDLVVEEYAGKTVVVVSHGGFINAVLHEISDGEVGTGITRILNTSITRLSTDDGRTWAIDVLNDADHLIDDDGKLNVLQPAAVDAAGSEAEEAAATGVRR
jgi:broad specificity phosphatase PhoE